MSLKTDSSRENLPLVKITGYSDIKRGKSKEVASIIAPYDPASLTSVFNNVVKPSNGVGSESGYGAFSHSESSDLSLTLWLDDTTFDSPLAFNKSRSSISDSVDKTIEKLFTLCADVDGDTHQPFFVSVVPSKMPMVGGASGAFGGLLYKMVIKNEIVDSKGNRVKARVDLTFKECLSPKQIKKKTGRSSPDLTHILQTTASDTLANKVQNIYGDVSTIYAVAEFNQLNTIRQIKNGEYLKFPPLDK